jgi:hypothetical protein
MSAINSSFAENYEALKQIEKMFTVRSSAVIDLNCFRLRLASNRTDFGGYAYFAKLVTSNLPAGSWDYEVLCVDLDVDDIDLNVIAPIVDQTFRSERFRSGFYLTHHFGPPAYLVTRGNRIWVFGQELDRTIWSYFAKHLLTIFAVDHAMIHLKAAAFVLPGAGATLLFGRGSGGKTVFLTQACQAGARFLSNTHVLIKDRLVYGIPSAMRVRNDRCFQSLISAGKLDPHMLEGEYRVDPTRIFDGSPLTQAPIQNLCIIDYRPGQPARFDQVEADAFCAFLDLFSFAIGTYGLKDDVLAHVGGDFERYVAAYSSMKAQLLELVQATPRYYINVDIFETGIRDRVLGFLARNAG